MQLYIQQTRETRPFPEEKQDKPESVKVLAKEVSFNLVPPLLLFAKNNRSLQRGFNPAKVAVVYSHLLCVNNYCAMQFYVVACMLSSCR